MEKRAEMGAEFFNGVAVPAGRGVCRDVEHTGDFDKGQVLPDFQVNNGSLFLWQFLKRFSHPFSEKIGVRVCGRSKELGRFQCSTFCSAGPGGAVAGLIHAGVMSHPEEESAQVSDFGEAAGFAGDARKDFLKRVLAVRLIPGEVEEEPVQGLGMSIVDF